MRVFNWPDKEAIIDLHDYLIERDGGALGFLDERKLESALERPKNAQYYENINDPY